MQFVGESPLNCNLKLKKSGKAALLYDFSQNGNLFQDNRQRQGDARRNGEFHRNGDGGPGDAQQVRGDGKGCGMDGVDAQAVAADQADGAPGVRFSGKARFHGYEYKRRPEPDIDLEIAVEGLEAAGAQRQAFHSLGDQTAENEGQDQKMPLTWTRITARQAIARSTSRYSGRP